MNVFKKLGNNLKRFSQILRRDGLNTAIYVYFYDLINRVTPFSIYRIFLLKAEKIPKGYDKLPPKFKIRALTELEALEYAKDPINDMTVSFVKESFANGETCFGVFDGDRLAEYGWFSGHPCHIRRELYFFYDNSYKYIHKVFTYPEYRGQRLHAFGKAYACHLYAEKGYKGILSTVEAHNLNSLRSNQRMGAEILGSLYVLMLLGRYRTYRDHSSQRLNCYLGRKKQDSIILNKISK
jgi:hypothetical protein